MSHLLPPHGGLPSGPMDMQPMFDAEIADQAMHSDAAADHPPTPAPSTGRKRKKQQDGSDGAPSQAEPRRLRRSHEACARCRTKKIKCDSKHPKCSACQSAGVDCHQEDRHRQTLTPRGHVEHLEHQLYQCELLLKHELGQDFTLDRLDTELLNRGMISGGPHTFSPFTTPVPMLPDANMPHSGNDPTRALHPYPNPAMPNVQFLYQGGPPFGPGPMSQSLHQFMPSGHPFPTSVYGYPPPTTELKGVDPKKNDISTEHALLNTFNVPPNAIQNTINPGEHEDLAVGLSGLWSGRDRHLNVSSAPIEAEKWKQVPMRRNTLASLMNPAEGAPETKPETSITIYLPINRETVKRMVHVYFERLNCHRPIFSRPGFEQRLDALYENGGGPHDPGFICSLYLILALGTMCELNNLIDEQKDSNDKSAISRARQGLPKDWPRYDSFFERALSIKPDLRVTISSLQALILLHWYLYTERQGRSLWRLVGSLVRMSIELGLHHDPRSQKSETKDEVTGERSIRHVFSEDECQTRIRLWDIVMLHDRGTSVLLGRPLAIDPSATNTPVPSLVHSPTQPEYSDHYQLTSSIAAVQAKIVSMLYRPLQLPGDEVFRNTTELIALLVKTRRQFGHKYQHFFEGTSTWTPQRRADLVDSITLDVGLTLLKFGITRLLLLRALFRHENGVPGAIQKIALHDAVITAHNIIVVHNQLIRFPDAAFFVSPIPLHISACVILFGHIWESPALDEPTKRADVYMALEMLPRFRWRWERKDLNGGHPYIHSLAEKIFGVTLNSSPLSGQPLYLLEERSWEHVDWQACDEVPESTSKVGAAINMPLQPHVKPMNQYAAFTAPGVGWYPHMPDQPVRPEDMLSANSAEAMHSRSENVAGRVGTLWHQQGYQQSYTSYMQEERDLPSTAPGPAPTWMQQTEPKLEMNGPSMSL